MQGANITHGLSSHAMLMKLSYNFYYNALSEIFDRQLCIYRCLQIAYEENAHVNHRQPLDLLVISMKKELPQVSYSSKSTQISFNIRDSKL